MALLGHLDCFLKCRNSQHAHSVDEVMELVEIEEVIDALPAKNSLQT